MKKIYFVRHGESEGNVGPIGNTPETPLTERGRAQADLVAARCAKLAVQTVISSTMLRARDTAAAILAKRDRPVEYSDLFVEVRRPSVQIGKPKDDPESVLARASIIEKFHIPGFRHSDEENFDDLKERARQALEYLAARPEENILVVTHGLFLRIMAAYAVMGDKLTGDVCLQFMRTLGTQNTGISALVYDPTISWRPWQVWIWNDHQHLADA